MSREDAHQAAYAAVDRERRTRLWPNPVFAATEAVIDYYEPLLREALVHIDSAQYPTIHAKLKEALG